MGALVDIPADLEPLQEMLGRSMLVVEQRMQRELRSDLPPVQRLCKHVSNYHGKMIRPALVFLSALACRADAATSTQVDPDESALTIASVCEMVHLATLVHDDVLDEADTRRRTTTVNALRGNEAAVILGDYLFSAAFRLCARLKDQQTSLRIADVGMTLCAGELLQLEHREDFSLDEATYHEIVKRKTASLIAAACSLGAAHAPGGPASADLPGRMEEFGLSLGIAFQIQDDLLDLTGDQSVVGKSLGKDLEKGKLTLPIIHHLAGASPEQRGRTLVLLRDEQSPPNVRGAALRTAMDVTDSVNFARASAEELVARARRAIMPLPESGAKRMLNLMADAVVKRTF